jgi:hypothetical protein
LQATIILIDNRSNGGGAAMNTFRATMSYLGAALIGAAIGFFAGREYLKYELRTAFHSALGNLEGEVARSSLSARQSPSPGSGKQVVKATPAAKNTATPPPETKQSPPVSLTLIDKGFTPRDIQAGDFHDHITLDMAIKNISGRNIRSFDGTLQFTDLLDNEIQAVKLDINDPITAGATIAWHGVLEYNQFVEGDKLLRAAAPINLKVVFVAKKVLFDDGTVQVFPEH